MAHVALEDTLAELCDGATDAFTYTDFSVVPPRQFTECFASAMSDATRTFESAYKAYTEITRAGVTLRTTRVIRNVPNEVYASVKRDGVRVRFAANKQGVESRFKSRSDQRDYSTSTLQEDRNIRVIIRAVDAIKRAMTASGMGTLMFMFDAELICLNPRRTDFIVNDENYPAINTESPTWELMIFDCFYNQGNLQLTTLDLDARITGIMQLMPAQMGNTIITRAEQTLLRFPHNQPNTISPQTKSTMANYCMDIFTNDADHEKEGIIFRDRLSTWSLKVKPRRTYQLQVVNQHGGGHVLAETFKLGGINVQTRTQAFGKPIPLGNTRVRLSGYAKNPLAIHTVTSDEWTNEDVIYQKGGIPPANTIVYYNEATHAWEGARGTATQFVVPRTRSTAYTDRALSNTVRALGNLFSSR